METLSRELIAKIGSFLKHGDRIALQLCSKKYDCVHEFINHHALKVKNENALDRLSNLSKIAKYVKRIKPKLASFELYFYRCEEAVWFDAARLNGTKLSITIIECDCVEDILRFVRNVTLSSLFVGFSREFVPRDVRAYATRSESFEVYAYKNQLSLLRELEFAKTISHLTIDTTDAWNPNPIIMKYLEKISVLRVFSKDLDLSIDDANKITNLAFVSSESRATASLIHAFSGDRIPINLKEVVCLDCSAANAANCDFAWYRLAKVFPKTTRYRFHAGYSSNIVPFLRRLIDIASVPAENVSVFYYSEKGFLACKALNVLMPQIKTEPFLHDSWPLLRYEPPQAHVSLRSAREIYDAMNSEQRFYWHFLEFIA